MSSTQNFLDNQGTLLVIQPARTIAAISIIHNHNEIMKSICTANNAPLSLTKGAVWQLWVRGWLNIPFRDFYITLDKPHTKKQVPSLYINDPFLMKIPATVEQQLLLFSCSFTLHTLPHIILVHHRVDKNRSLVRTHP